MKTRRDAGWTTSVESSIGIDLLALDRRIYVFVAFFHVHASHLRRTLAARIKRSGGFLIAREIHLAFGILFRANAVRCFFLPLCPSSHPLVNGCVTLRVFERSARFSFLLSSLFIIIPRPAMSQSRVLKSSLTQSMHRSEPALNRAPIGSDTDTFIATVKGLGPPYENPKAPRR